MFQATKYILVNDFGRQETQQIQNMETVSSADGSNLQVSDGMKIVQR